MSTSIRHPFTVRWVLPQELFTPIFAISRVVGWTSHILEQWSNNRLIRPRAEYVGPNDLHYSEITLRPH